jgi:hypothetical protein
MISLYTFENINHEQKYAFEKAVFIDYYLGADGSNNIIYGTENTSIWTKIYKGDVLESDIFVTNLEEASATRCKQINWMDVSSDGSMWVALCDLMILYVG